ncbi:response regulator transcription factor [Cohnella algarum]|uniref:response regulator transcription factor n=1 Tax=Cohnella algarum TaxID=2044859 RepID=UPI001967DE21|nr:response regulator [Cohnella algarum]MBN2982469.1 response regulator [Cohnella algarum]
MYRMLIIDDEPIIVNGLTEYFAKRSLKEVEVLSAYSAEEALSWLGSVKIDVVLSDICMPGMSGMELLVHIEKQWPRCKVIFLTGHNEFEYAHKAIRSGSVTDYILKTEGMERIGSAVDATLKAVKEELSVYHHKEWLQQELPKAIAQLQRQLLLDVLRRTEASSFRALRAEFEALKLPLDAGRPVVVISLFVENWGKYKSVHERDLMLFAIGNIAEELLGTRTAVKCVQYDGNSVVGLVQERGQPLAAAPGAATGWTPGAARAVSDASEVAIGGLAVSGAPGASSAEASTAAKRERLAAGFAHGTLETVQQVVRELFGLPLSASASGAFVPFDKVAREAHRLRLAGLNGRFAGSEGLTIVTEQDGGDVRTPETSERLSAEYLLERLRQAVLEGGGDGGEWSECYEKLVRMYPESGPDDPFDRMLLQQALGKHLLVCLEELGLKDRAISQANLLAVLQFDSRTPWNELVHFYQSLLEWIQAVRNDQLRLAESNLIGRIHYFIRNNLHGDLSMSRIAREVSLNPSYLSRWYKQTCGKGLSDHIQEARTERSKELLKTTTLKMHEISQMLGFADPHYFFRFFKKTVGCTPQEYRNGTAPEQEVKERYRK